jgi:cytochrome c oxidase cbb3-type subunit III
MSEDPKQDRLLDEEHDGIQEYDNPTPRWWIWLFAATVVFAVLYWFNVPGLGVGKGRIANYEAEMAKARERYASRPPAAAALSDSTLVAMAADHEELEKGRAVFAGNCVPCHRADGGGVIGPDLTDDHWIHGGKPSRILHTIETGVLDKGMPAWGTVLRPDDIPAVTAWVMHLHGSNPKDPKAPQGNLETWEGGPVAKD